MRRSGFVAAGHRHRAGFKTVVSGKVQQGGMEADGLTPALQHGTLEVVVQQDPGQPLPSHEGRLMTAQKVGHPGIEIETQKDTP